MKIDANNIKKIPFPIFPSINCHIARAKMIPAMTSLKFLLNIIVFLTAAKVRKTNGNYFKLGFVRVKTLRIFARSFKDRS